MPGCNPKKRIFFLLIFLFYFIFRWYYIVDRRELLSVPYVASKAEKVEKGEMAESLEQELNGNNRRRRRRAWIIVGA
jgi:hypothetical protein